MRRIKAWDAVPLVLTLGVIALFSVRAYAGGGTGLRVRIQAQEGVFIYPMDKDAEIQVMGPLGDTHVHIGGGAVWVEDSPCREKVCVSAGRLLRAGTWLACLPNRVFVQVEGKDDEEIDAATF